MLRASSSAPLRETEGGARDWEVRNISRVRIASLTLPFSAQAMRHLECGSARRRGWPADACDYVDAAFDLDPGVPASTTKRADSASATEPSVEIP